MNHRERILLETLSNLAMYFNIVGGDKRNLQEFAELVQRETTPVQQVQSPSNNFRIDHIWCWLSVDEGGEGICATRTESGMFLPLLAADERRLADIRGWAERIAYASGKPAVLAKFTNRINLERLGGQ